jgi:hypothetical protein
MQQVTLNNGIEMPIAGFGVFQTWRARDVSRIDRQEELFSHRDPAFVKRRSERKLTYDRHCVSVQPDRRLLLATRSEKRLIAGAASVRGVRSGRAGSIGAFNEAGEA